MEQLYFGGSVLTMRGEHDIQEALLVRDGVIAYVGNCQEAKRLAQPQAEKIDLKGRCLMPGFIDPHSHIVMAAQFSAMADLTECKDFKEIQDTLRRFISEKGLGEQDIVMAIGYDHNFLKEKRHPDKLILDEVSKGIPIYISHASGHMGAANTAALKLAGISADTPDPKGGKFGRGPDGEPDGYVEEVTAITALMMPLQKRLKLDLEELVCKVQELYFKNGITTCQDGASNEDNLRLLASLAEKSKLKLDVVAYPLLNMEANKALRAFSAYDGGYKNHLKIGGVKIILDGSPQGKTAWLTKPYTGSDETGESAYDDETVKNFCASAIGSRRQLLAHCNGDAAGDQLIRCYKDALSQSKETDKTSLRPVMIHCQTVRPDQLDEMKQLGMIPSIFVAHTYYWGDIHLKNLGPERGNRISPARSAFERGLKVTFHQDTPVLKPNMLETVWCAVNRKTRGGQTIGPEEAITPFEALQTITVNGAYSYFEEASKGLLQEGYRADMVLLSQNPLVVPKEKIRDIRVEATIKDGKFVYSAD